LLIEMSICNKVDVSVYLTKFSPYRSSGSCTLYAPRFNPFPKDLEREDFIVRGIPYVYICNDFVEAYAGTFRPEKIFYIHSSDSQGIQHIMISDEISYIVESLKKSITIDSESFISFLEFRNVLGKRTLVKNIYLLEAGYTLRVDESGISLRPRFRYGDSSITLSSIEELEEMFMNIVFQVFNEYVNVLKKTNALVIVPLSAGVDSRFVLSMLHIIGYKNVITVTYGLRSSEYPIAKRVAEALGYENIFIEYTWDLWKKYLDQMLNYMVWASQLYIVPNIQGFVSTSEIFSKICHRDVKKCNNVIFLTGDVGSEVTGKIPPPAELLGLRSIEELLDFILRGYSLFKSCNEVHNMSPKISASLRASILNSIEEIVRCKKNADRTYRIDFVDIYETFCWKEGQFKYVSSMRIPCIYYGFRFVSPLWDGRIIRFLSSVPWKFKYKSRLYRNTLRKHLFKPLGIDIEDPTKERQGIINMLKPLVNVVLPFMPKKLPSLLQDFIRRRQNTRNPCGFEIFFPRIFTLTYQPNKDILTRNKEIADIVNSYLKRQSQSEVAFNALTCSLLITKALSRVE